MVQCPACNWDMKHTPNDQLVQYTCKRSACGYMATEEYMNNLTEKDITRIKKELQDTKRYREQQKANREIAAIEKARHEVDGKQTVHDISRKYKRMSAITDFVKE